MLLLRKQEPPRHLTGKSQHSQLKFAKNNSRVVEKAGQSTQKKDPILLIVFDISGSMDEVLANDQNAYSTLVDKIRKTKIYQKIVAEEEA